MITPRLLRRSLRAGAQWRVLALWWASLLLPTLIAALPVLAWLGGLLDRSTRAQQVVAWLDGATLIELVRQSGEGRGAALSGGYLAGLLVLLCTSPLLAAVMAAAARADEPLRMHQLLGAAGALAGRMARLALVGLGALGVAGALAAGAFKLASDAGEKAVWARQAERQMLLAVAASAVALWLAHLTLDAGRAVLSAEPSRRSSFLAWCAGVRLLVRQPLRALLLGLLGSVAGFGVAAVVMVARLRLEQRGPVRVGLAWALAQVAVLAVGWGKAARIAGLAELSRADAAERLRRSAFVMSPPATSPPPPEPAAEPPLEPGLELPAAPPPEPALELPAAPVATPAAPDVAAPPALSPPDRSDS